ncbi:protein RKD5 [Humulus lupulus]|uniref:protein RKD5 n=1 Tax=Humulus lupulus TaxID=3486 RepID=UPI002B402425|nr:protein RKD5 [Humulus lupulus]
MDSSSKTHFLISLLIFKNTLNRELIRSLHAYRWSDGKESEVEREFVFSTNGTYNEMEANPLLLGLTDCRVSDVSKGLVNGLWVCIFAFHNHHPHFPHLTSIPSLLTPSKNPKLRSIPSLANDLQAIFQMNCMTTFTDDKEPSQLDLPSNENENQPPKRRNLVLYQDLNCLPDPDTPSQSSDDQRMDQSSPSSGGVDEKKKLKKKRAASKDIARIALSDLAKYFDLPIVEASRNLKVGLTVLKKKCREFGIPRWPHRKIKSLDSLIRDLQVEKKWKEENKAAAIAAAKRKMMLQNEKESIEKTPFLEMKTETKRFRQDVFKRRHRDRVLRTQQASSITQD